jgi:hypothetical protein
MAKIDIRGILARDNRGLLFDVVIFLLNVFLFGELTGRLRELIELAKADDYYAKLTVTFFIYGLCILPGLAAILKFLFSPRRSPGHYTELWDEMFKNVLAFILVGQSVAMLLFLLVAGENQAELRELPGNTAFWDHLLTPLFYLALIMAITAPAFIYLYFSLSQLKFLAKFAKLLKLEILGDLVIFLNLILYQAFWGILAADLTKDFGNIPGRISTLAFTVVVIYLPPRIFFLAEDAHRPLAWLTIGLANLPLILRVVFF